MPLLTLHIERIDRVLRNVHRHSADGVHLAGHWLVQTAIDSEVITWNRAAWPTVMLTARAGSSGNLEIAYLLADEGPWLLGEVDGTPPAGWDDLTPDEQHELPWTLPDPTQQPTEYLTLVVDEFNRLHQRTEALMKAWPGGSEESKE